MIAPIDFIKEKYINPNKITQDKLCEILQIGKKTISELYQKKRGFTIHTAKKFAKFFDLKPEFILLKQMEYDLSLDKENYDFIRPYNKFLEEENLAIKIVSEGVMIGGWVALWEALAIVLVNWLPLNKNLKIYKKIANSKVEIF